MKMKTKWILFDFGGCLDSDGIHSRTLFYNCFVEQGILEKGYNLDSFQEAYTYSDRRVIQESLITGSGLLEMNEIMCSYIAQNLNIKSNIDIFKVAKAITDYQSSSLKRNKMTLENLKSFYQLGIISNFSGNLNIILDEFSLRPNFNFVLDSYHVGFSKPSPEIFKIAISKCQTDPSNIYFVGDNILNDIIPAKELGMKTVLIQPREELNITNDIADYKISSLKELLILDL